MQSGGREDDRERERGGGGDQQPDARFEPTTSQVHGIHLNPRIHRDAPQLRDSSSQVYSSIGSAVITVLVSLKSPLTGADW